MPFNLWSPEDPLWRPLQNGDCLWRPLQNGDGRIPRDHLVYFVDVSPTIGELMLNIANGGTTQIPQYSHYQLRTYRTFHHTSFIAKDWEALTNCTRLEILRMTELLLPKDFVACTQEGSDLKKITPFEALWITLLRLNHRVTPEAIEKVFGYRASIIPEIEEATIRCIYKNWNHLLGCPNSKSSSLYGDQAYRLLSSDRFEYFSEKIEETLAMYVELKLQNCCGFLGLFSDWEHAKIDNLQLLPVEESQNKPASDGRRINYRVLAGPDGMVYNFHEQVDRRSEGEALDTGTKLEQQLLSYAKGKVLLANDSSICSSIVIKAHDKNERRVPRANYMGFDYGMTLKDAHRNALRMVEGLDSFWKGLGEKRRIMEKGEAVWFRAALILQNCRTACRGRATGDFYGCKPPDLETYLSQKSLKV